MAGIDAHLAWCGRCESMEQNYRALHMKLDEDFVRMEFYSAVEEFIPHEIIASLKTPLSCKPRFLIFTEGELKEEIDGADCTKLETCL